MKGIAGRALRILCTAGTLALAGCGSVTTLPCNTPTALNGSDDVEVRYFRTPGAAATAATAAVPTACVTSALDSFECPEICPFESVTGVTFATTGSSSRYSFFRSLADFFSRSWYIGEADYDWAATGLCTARARGNPLFGAPATGCPGAAIIINAQANSREDVGIRVGGTVLCGPAPGTPLPSALVRITYPDNVTNVVTADGNGRFTDLRDDFDGTGTVTIVVVGNDNVPATVPVPVRGGGP